ncbi:helix-turn-helix domain-containing protein [Paracoccus cavernae]|uniref:helix-turn-helix domain-containing protein n=1 Tax=Paracoccus cavernae TaxID=1571207 RepID=UPI0036128334
MIEQECFTPTQLQYFSNKFTDSESLAASIPGGKVDSLPTGHVDFLGKARLVELGHNIALQSAWANAPVSFRTELASVGGATHSFFFVGNNAADPQSAVDGIHLRTNAVLMRRSGDVSNLKTSSALDIGAVCIPDLTLQRALSALTGKEKMATPLVRGMLRNADMVQMANLRCRYSDIISMVDAGRWGTAANSRALTDFAGDGIITGIVKLLDTGDLKIDHLAHRLQTASMRRIDQLIDEDSDCLIGLQELCEGARLSLRTIESIIRRRMGMTAHSYLQRRRLSRVRQALLTPREIRTVTSIAMDHGFTHLGRFSAFYRQMYGELPSETLRKATGRLISSPPHDKGCE